MPPEIEIVPGSACRRGVLAASDLSALFDALARRGWTVVGPTVRDGAIVYDTIRGPADLPAGWTDVQSGGKYRLERRADAAFFGHVVGPHSWKRYLLPPEQRLFRARKTPEGIEFLPEVPETPRRAFLGVRACELKAIGVQDRVFLGGTHRDPTYASRRSNVLIIAVNCGQAGGTCFCASMGTGPRVGPGHDLSLTELLEDGRHRFLVECGSAQGEAILSELPVRAADPVDIGQAEAAVARAESQMGRAMDTRGIRDLLMGNLESPVWDRVAERCLSCANCTMACPTCFCSSVDDVTDLTGDHAERWRRWDSCFNTSFTHLAGGAVRTTVKSRYRQWLTHKLGTWHDQFGESGCVGCGRCITWCPVGIDLTEEIRSLREASTTEKTRP